MAPDNEHQDHAAGTGAGPVDGEVERERLVTTRVTERVVGRDCEHCGTWVDYSGTGRPPRYCSKNCRNRASELRTAEARIGRQLAAGQLRTEPVREVIERTTERVIERTRTRYAALPAAAQPAPATAREWAAQLHQLAADLRAPGPLQRRHFDHRHLHHALADVLAALNDVHPGGLADLQH